MRSVAAAQSGAIRQPCPVDQRIEVLIGPVEIIGDQVRIQRRRYGRQTMPSPARVFTRRPSAEVIDTAAGRFSRFAPSP